MLHLDPVEGKRTEESTPPLDLASYLNGCNVESIFTTDHEKINLKHIREQVAEHVEEPHKVENFVNALVDTDLATLIYGEDLRDDPAELKKVLDEEHITEGFEILDKVEALQTKYLLATRKTQLLKFNVWDLTEKIKLLESNIPLQEHQIQEPRDSEEGRDALVLSPLQSIYLRHFHDQVREGIAEKLSDTSLSVRHQRALRLRVHGKSMDLRCGEEKILQHNLWRFMQEMHAAWPESFSTTTMWNQFVDELLGEEALVGLLSLSPQAILTTRFGSSVEGLATQNPQVRPYMKQGLGLLLFCYVRFLQPNYYSILNWQLLVTVTNGFPQLVGRYV